MVAKMGRPAPAAGIVSARAATLTLAPLPAPALARAAWLRELSRERYVSPCHLAYVHTGLGD
jgi:hypothetical protein